jgi:hypothetical protein
MTTMPPPPSFARACVAVGLTFACMVAVGIAACGGGSNPLDNAETIQNEALAGARKLSFAYFQRCINPIFQAQLASNINGTISTNTCAAAGCHDNVNGTGGAFRLTASTQVFDFNDPASTPDTIRSADIYKNYYSAQGEVVFGSTTQSRLLAKPRLLNVLHGGGLIFDSADDPNVKLIEYWIQHPMPVGQDEFSDAADTLFTPPSRDTGACNTQ